MFIFSTEIFSVEFTDFANNGTEYVWDQSNLYEEALTVYLEAFRKLYTELEVKDREEHFKETMHNELTLVKQHPDKIHWLIAKNDDKMIGLAIFELFEYPNVYIRELAVLPEYQRQGIGRQLTFAILKDNSDIRKISIITRNINKPSIEFYSTLGFHPSDFCHAEYDPKKYFGMELPFREAKAHKEKS